ncbi:MAG: hypothetical protein DHS20C18_21730 [Saprospiraceae bacterium]|nr:MAG: hypothetical protein DHS20C18_21730 [Saprospiraceae bacterium]
MENLNDNKVAQLKKLIADDKLEEACEVLMTTSFADKSRELSARLKNVERQYKLNGIISHGEYVKERNTIRIAISGLVKDLENFNNIAEADIFGELTEKYRNSMLDRLGQIKVLGQSKPKSLLNLNVRVNILNRIPSRSGMEIQRLNEDLDFARSRSNYPHIATEDGGWIVQHTAKVIILGKPGAGKTTFLRFLALKMLLNQQHHYIPRRLPIFVTIRDWVDTEKSLVTYINDQFKVCEIEQTEWFVENMLK